MCLFAFLHERLNCQHLIDLKIISTLIVHNQHHVEDIIIFFYLLKIVSVLFFFRQLKFF